jgi:hypothetical protein
MFFSQNFPLPLFFFQTHLRKDLTFGLSRVTIMYISLLEFEFGSFFMRNRDNFFTEDLFLTVVDTLKPQLKKRERKKRKILEYFFFFIACKKRIWWIEKISIWGCTPFFVVLEKNVFYFSLSTSHNYHLIFFVFPSVPILYLQHHLFLYYYII